MRVPHAASNPTRVAMWPGRDSSSNPYISLLIDAVESAGSVEVHSYRPGALMWRYDVWHIHWPDRATSHQFAPIALIGLMALCLQLLVARLSGTRIVVTRHNRRPRDAVHPFMATLASAIVTRISHHRIYLTEESLMWDERALGPKSVIPHGHYLDAYPVPPSRMQARQVLGIDADAKVVLLFGKLRTYKHGAELAEVMREVVDGVLLVAGKTPAKDPSADAILAVEISVRLGEVASDTVPLVFAASDVAFIGNRDSNSGTAILALGFGCPVWVNDADLAASLASFTVGALHLSISGANARDVSRVLAWSACVDPVAVRTDVKTHLDWQNIGVSTVAVYEAECAAKDRRCQ